MPLPGQERRMEFLKGSLKGSIKGYYKGSI